MVLLFLINKKKHFKRDSKFVQISMKYGVSNPCAL